LLEVAFFTTSTLLMGYFGAPILAAFQIIIVITATSFLLPSSVATAAMVRVGLSAGAGNRTGVLYAGAMAIVMAAVAMGIAGLAFVLFRVPIIQLFVPYSSPDAAAVVSAGQTFLLFAAAYQLFDGIQVTANFALRGMKDTIVPMWLAVGSYWIIGFPSALLLAFALKLGAVGIWIAFVLALFVAASTMLGRFIWMTSSERDRPQT
jgi:MATE family multidrug resistance protein